MEWVEIKAPSVEVAVEAGLSELGLSSREEADIEVLQEPEKGFLGFGGKDAVVRIKARSKKRRRKRSSTPGKDQRRRGQGRRQEQGGAKKRENGPRRPPSQAQPKPKAEEKPKPAQSREATMSREEQASVVREFLEGLLEAFGLAGEVNTRIEDDIIHADVVGSETEALVGARGSILQSIHELAKTVVQRKTQESARIRLDIAGYAERRREALKIYAQRLGQQVVDEGGEVILEPMNAAERKIIHDTISEIEGVRTYSEGEEPRRSVVIAAESGEG